MYNFKVGFFYRNNLALDNFVYKYEGIKNEKHCFKDYDIHNPEDCCSSKYDKNDDHLFFFEEQKFQPKIIFNGIKSKSNSIRFS